MKKLHSLLFWGAHALLLFMMVASAIYYFTEPAVVAEAFRDLEYPVYTMYFNATAKILGGLAIVLPQVPKFLKEWAYAGYLFILLLAFQALYVTMPEFPWLILVCIAIWGIAYFEFKKRS